MTTPLKRSLGEIREVLPTPPASPQKPLPSPSKRARSGSSINGLAVEPLSPHRSPHKSPHKVLSQVHEQSSERPSLAKRDLTMAFEAEAKPAAARKEPRPPNLNLAYQIFQRNMNQVTPCIKAQAWNRLRTSLQLMEVKGVTDKGVPNELNAELDHLILRNWELATADKNPKDVKKFLLNLAFKQIEMGKYCDLRQTCEEFLRHLELSIRNELPIEKIGEVITRGDISHQLPKDFIDLLLMEGICTLSSGNDNEAKLYFEKAVAKFGVFTEADQQSDHFFLINCAFQELMKALLKAEGNTDLMLQLLNLIYPMQCLICTLDERLVTLQIQNEMKPGSTLLKQASIYFQLSSIEEALDTLEDALENQDQISSSFQELMDFGFQLRAVWGERQENVLLELASKYFDWAMKQPMQPGERSHALKMKYRTSRLLKDFTQALVARQILEQLEPSNPAHLLLQAECCFKLGRPAQGVELLRRASEIRNEESTEITEEIVSYMLDLIPDTGYEDLVLEYTNWINDITQQMDN